MQLPFCETSFLSLLVFLPLLGCVLLALPVFSAASDPEGGRSRNFSMFVSLLTFVLSLFLLGAFDGAQSAMQFTESRSWIPRFGIRYELGVDGISLFLVLLTTFLMPIVILASHSVKKHLRGYLANMLALETAMLGTLARFGSFLILCLLGADACSHVLHYRYLGR